MDLYLFELLKVCCAVRSVRERSGRARFVLLFISCDTVAECPGGWLHCLCGQIPSSSWASLGCSTNSFVIWPISVSPYFCYQQNVFTNYPLSIRCFCDACGPVAEKLLRSQIRRSVGDCQYITRWPIYNMIWWMGLWMDRKDGTKIQKS